MNQSILAILQQTFKSQRLSLDALTNADAAFILALTNSNGWLQFIGDREIHSLVDAIAYIEKIDANPAAKYWKVSLQNTGEAIGIITLIQRDYLEDLDIGFAFLPHFTRKGYALEATQVILDQVLPRSSRGIILGVTKPDNTASIQLLKRLGFQQKETKKVGEEALEVYAITQEKQAV